MTAPDTAAVLAGWQPIASAPRDGTMIRFFYDDGVQSERYWNSGWCKDVGWPVAYNYRFANPTHWMPLPPAPEPTPESASVGASA